MLEKFQNLNISEVIIRALNEMGFEEPTRSSPNRFRSP